MVNGHAFRVKYGKVDVRLPGKGNSKSHGARPVHLIITMIKWIRIIRLSIKNSLSEGIYRIGAKRVVTATYGICILQGYLAHKKLPTPLRPP